MIIDGKIVQIIKNKDIRSYRFFPERCLKDKHVVVITRKDMPDNYIGIIKFKLRHFFSDFYWTLITDSIDDLTAGKIISAEVGPCYENSYYLMVKQWLTRQ